MLLQNGVVVVVVFLKILWMFDVLQSEVGNKNIGKKMLANIYIYKKFCTAYRCKLSKLYIQHCVIQVWTYCEGLMFYKMTLA